MIGAFAPPFGAPGVIGSKGDDAAAVVIGDLGVAGVGPAPTWNADAEAVEGGEELLFELLAVLGGDDDMASAMRGEPPEGQARDDAGGFAGPIWGGEGAEDAA